MPVSTSDGNNHLSSFAYDAAGNATSDGAFSYVWNAESQLKSAGATNYVYDGDGRRAAKVGSKLYWYGSGGEILAETNASGTTLNEYVFFGGKRVAMLPSGSTAQFYVEDSLGSSRIVTTNTGVVCYDADFAPFGAENAITNSCTQNVYKFEGKERDAETSTLSGNANGNDYFGARYYSNRYGRWLSADWSNVPAPVPYANLSNPQTLNLYAMVADDPESFADLDGHDGISWDDVSHVGQAVGTLLAGGSLAAPSVAAVATGGLIVGVELEAFDLAVSYPHEPCNCAVDALDPPYIQAPAQKEDTTNNPPADRTAENELRRDANGKAIPDPEANGAPHTQLGTRTSKSQKGNPRYRQGMEFDKNGKPVRRVDHTNHGRKNHPNPHMHDVDPSTGKIGPALPLPNPPLIPLPPPPTR
jgi:RHS repeat-associated protein